MFLLLEWPEFDLFQTIKLSMRKLVEFGTYWWHSNKVDTMDDLWTPFEWFVCSSSDIFTCVLHQCHAGCLITIWDTKIWQTNSCCHIDCLAAKNFPRPLWFWPPDRCSASAELHKLCSCKYSHRFEIATKIWQKRDRWIYSLCLFRQTIMIRFQMYLSLYPHFHTMYVPLNLAIVASWCF